jgi:hypothetical protein
MAARHLLKLPLRSLSWPAKIGAQGWDVARIDQTGKFWRRAIAFQRALNGGTDR